MLQWWWKTLKDNVFHRDLSKTYPIITHGKGVYLIDENGKHYLDASSGAVAANLGHDNEKIAKAMYEQAKKVGFVHTLRFETENLHQLATKIAQMAPASLNKVYFASGGSEANESAFKLAYQYHQLRGNGTKTKIIGRWQSYHGNTLGSLSVGGDVKRRQLYSNMLIESIHVDGPLSNHHYKNEAAHTEALLQQLTRQINEVGAQNIAALIVEPIVGSQQGAVVPPPMYLKRVKEICEENDMLMIVDEVMTGFGRTGTNFAIEHFSVTPDIITFGKGVSAGYAPLSGMIVSDAIVHEIKTEADGKFVHGYTYSGHPVSVSAGLAALEIYEEKEVLENVAQISSYLFDALDQLKKEVDFIIDVRGKGLLIGVECIETEQSKRLFPTAMLAEAINEKCMEEGMIVYPGSGGIDGTKGQHILIAPPLTITMAEAENVIAILKKVLKPKGKA